MSQRVKWARLAAVTLGSFAIAWACQAWLGSTWLEVAAFVTSVAGVYLVWQEDIWNFPIGIVSVLIYAWIFLTYPRPLYADMSLMLFFAAVQVYGWYSWLWGGRSRTGLKVSGLQPKHWTWVIGGVVVGTAVYLPIITLAAGKRPFMDSFLAMLSIVAQILTDRKKIESWILWIVADALYVGLYFDQKYYPSAILYAIFVVLAVLGFRSWRKSLAAQTTPEPG